jgi:hypothetical protein
VSAKRLRISIFGLIPYGSDDGRICGEEWQTYSDHLPIDEYEELLQDLDDLEVIALRKKEPTTPLAEVKRRLKETKR